MTTIIFIEADGTRTEARAEPGMSVMQTAVAAGITGIVAECGGSLYCGTCHCQVDADWYDRLPEASSSERDMLEFVINPTVHSRLSCQIAASPAVDGLIVHVPASQT